MEFSSLSAGMIGYLFSSVLSSIFVLYKKYTHFLNIVTVVTDFSWIYVYIIDMLYCTFVLKCVIYHWNILCQRIHVNNPNFIVHVTRSSLLSTRLLMNILMTRNPWMRGEHCLCNPQGCNQDGCSEFERIYPEKYEKTHGFWRPIIRSSIEQFLKCGDLKEGLSLRSPS